MGVATGRRLAVPIENAVALDKAALTATFLTLHGMTILTGRGWIIAELVGFVYANPQRLAAVRTITSGPEVGEPVIYNRS